MVFFYGFENNKSNVDQIHLQDQNVKRLVIGK